MKRTPIQTVVDHDLYVMQIDRVGSLEETVHIRQFSESSNEVSEILIEMDVLDPLLMSLLAIRNCWELKIKGDLYLYQNRYIGALQYTTDEGLSAFTCVCDTAILINKKLPTDVYSPILRVGEFFAKPLDKMVPFQMKLPEEVLK